MVTDTTLRPAPSPRAAADRRRAATHGRGFRLIGLAFATAMAFATVPAPLYPVYSAADGWSTFTVTVVFAAYSVGVMAALLLAGHVSDHLGRRPVVAASLGLEVVSAALFLAGTTLPVVLAGRLVSGLGIGMLTATATAQLAELDRVHRPGSPATRFETVSTVANIGGLGLGPLVSGVLAEYLPAPLRLPYAVFAVLLLLALAGVALTPETVRRPERLPRYRPQRVSADHLDPAQGGRTAFVAAALSSVAGFSIVGLANSVVPGFVHGTLGVASSAVAGVVVFAVLLAAVVAQVTTGTVEPRRRVAVAAPVQATGLVVLLAGMLAASLPLFLAGGVVAGAAGGVLFKTAVGTVAGAAAPAHRGEALASLFLAAYLGLVVVSVGLGVATLVVPATTAMTGLTVVLLALLVAVALTDRRARRPLA